MELGTTGLDRYTARLCIETQLIYYIVHQSIRCSRTDRARLHDSQPRWSRDAKLIADSVGPRPHRGRRREKLTNLAQRRDGAIAVRRTVERRHASDTTMSLSPGDWTSIHCAVLQRFYRRRQVVTSRSIQSYTSLTSSRLISVELLLVAVCYTNE